MDEVKEETEGDQTVTPVVTRPNPPIVQEMSNKQAYAPPEFIVDASAYTEYKKWLRRWS